MHIKMYGGCIQDMPNTLKTFYNFLFFLHFFRWAQTFSRPRFDKGKFHIFANLPWGPFFSHVLRGCDIQENFLGVFAMFYNNSFSLGGVWLFKVQKCRGVKPPGTSFMYIPKGGLCEPLHNYDQRFLSPNIKYWK